MMSAQRPGGTSFGGRHGRTAVEEGVELCRSGEWARGYLSLSRAVEQGSRLTSVARSYLGFLLAARDGHYWEGLELCRKAVEAEFFQPEIQVNLARTYLLRERRREAVAALERALEIDPEHAGALHLHRLLGQRNRPAIPFLRRSNPINRLIGSLRSAVGS